MSDTVMNEAIEQEVATKPTARSASRLSVNLPPALIDELKELAEEEHVTVTEIVRRAISAERFLRDHINAGNKLLIQEKGQSTPSRVVIFR